MKRILALHTGGTTSTYADEADNICPDTDNPMNHVGVNLESIQVTALDFFNVLSPYITPKHMLKLYQEIKKNTDSYDDIVITHGTNTLEETAYFFGTVEIPNILIVLTGAMRSSDELGSDDVYNYLSALRVASHDQAIGEGILVVINDEIHAAKYVTKMYTINVLTFQMSIHGPFGLITKHDILFFGTVDPRVRFDLQDISGMVPVVKAHAGMGGDGIISFLNPGDVCGIIVETLGVGSVPPRAAQGIVDLVKQGVSVVLVSRCFNGITEPVYAYEGGDVQPVKVGVMPVKELNTQKARLKLLVALNTGLKGQTLKEYIEG